MKKKYLSLGIILFFTFLTSVIGGYITSNFFKSKIIDRAKFMSGPFTNMFFDILKKQKNKFEVLMGNLKVSVSNKEIIYLSH